MYTMQSEKPIGVNMESIHLDKSESVFFTIGKLVIKGR